MEYKIFISYRRKDSFGIAKVLHDKLSTKFGAKSVFLDTEDIQGGEQWEQVLKKSGKYAKIAIVLIGEQWLETNDAGNYRIKEDGDWVRKEIRQALKHKLAIFPILIDGATMPTKEDLPEDIHVITKYQALNLRSTRFDDDFDHISRSICNTLHSKLICFFLRHKKLILGGLIFAVLALLLFLFIPKNDPNACPPFTESSDLNVLFISSRQAGEGDQVVKEFYDKSKPNFNADIQHYGDPVNALTKYESVTRSCDADLFLAVQNSPSEKEFRFGFSNDSLVRFSYTKDLKRTLVSTTFSELVNDKAFHESMDGLICFLATYIYLTKGPEFVKQDFQSQCELGDSNNVALKKLYYDMQSDIYIMKKDYVNALKSIEASEALEPVDVLTKAKKADIAEKLKRFDVAVDAYTELIESGTTFNNSKLFEKRGDQYLELKDYKNAKEDYEKAEMLSPGNRQIHQKHEGVQSEIKTINTDLNGSLQRPNLRDEQKIKNAEQAVQVGRFDDAENILNTLNPESKNTPEVKGLDLEIKLEKGELDKTQIIIPEGKLSNQRLRAKVKIDNIPNGSR